MYGYCREKLTLELPRSDCWFSPLDASHSLVNQLQEFGFRSRQQPLTDKFEDSHNLFAGLCSDTYREKLHFNHFWNQKGQLDGIDFHLNLFSLFDVCFSLVYFCVHILDFSNLYSIVVCGRLFLSAANVSMRAWNWNCVCCLSFRWPVLLTRPVL